MRLDAYKLTKLAFVICKVDTLQPAILDAYLTARVDMDKKMVIVLLYFVIISFSDCPYVQCPVPSSSILWLDAFDIGLPELMAYNWEWLLNSYLPLALKTMSIICVCLLSDNSGELLSVWAGSVAGQRGQRETGQRRLYRP